MFRASTAHHQEVRCMYVCGKWYFQDDCQRAWVEWNSAQFHSTLPPDDGLLMPETCRGILIQQTKKKQCIELVIYTQFMMHGQPNIKKQTHMRTRCIKCLNCSVTYWV
jgi:hypothetical protein